MTATKEKKTTLEIPLKELKEVREIWLDVCAFNHVLKELNDGDDSYDALLRFYRPIYERFNELLAGEPAWDSRIRDLEYPREGGGE